MMQMTPMIKQLIILNVLFFIGSNTIAPIAYDYFALHFPLNEGFRFWQPLTHMFMHAKAPMIMHIFFNMFGLLMFGSPLEHFWGAKKFLFFYISCGFGAALLHVGIDYYQFQQVYDVLISNGVSAQEIQKIVETGEYNTAIEQFVSKQNLTEMYRSYHTTAVGASGALYGIIVAFAFMFPNAEMMLLFLPIPIKAKYFVPFLVLGDLVMGIKGTSIFGGGGIAHFAHVGGAVTGFLIMWYWKKTQFNRHRWD
ncbi:MAG: rhomboid family intramembrane serine protease [Flavobacterium sp.]